MQQAAAAAPRERYRRRTYVVNRRFQLKYAAIITSIGTVIAGGLGIFLYSSIKESTSIVLETVAEYPELQQQIVDNDRQTALIIVLGVFAICVSLLGWGILMTHRVAGPLFIITRYVNSVTDGTYPFMRPLRDGDELHDFFEAFKGMIEELRVHDTRDLASITESMERLEAIKKDPGAAGPREAELIANLLREIAGHKSRRLGRSHDIEVVADGKPAGEGAAPSGAAPPAAG